MKKLIYVINELNLNDNEHYVIGVADSLQNVNNIVDEYYGEYETIDYQDIRDSNLEWIKRIKVPGIKKDEFYNYKIWVEFFILNEI